MALPITSALMTATLCGMSDFPVVQKSDCGFDNIISRLINIDGDGGFVGAWHFQGGELAGQKGWWHEVTLAVGDALLQHVN